MSIRFLIDEDCPLSLETLLNSKGHDTIHVKTSRLSGTKDPELKEKVERKKEKICIDYSVT
ncbi:DUF5615 family PIN-like protein [Pseudanabaena sp. 'Roaring Creek']|uniref:DUF5615 family PIN-like protein n=1 Tax=Pseudanabaena sp. 'Roaring Creek' TaxID=1681830 RepID=UPI00092E2554|nr:DUF5615 family PIN-like protein [Pseudanabaena sp. 'Roaring Creek']